MTKMTTSPTIRLEQPGDREAVLAINRAAFASDVEPALVSRLWSDGDALFALVAEVNGQPVGHILFSRLPITQPNGGTLVAAALAPLAVFPAYQRQGIGSSLVREGLAQCRERNLPAVIVLGDPTYYTRFGFQPDLARNLETPWSGPYLMAIELLPGSLRDGQAVARYPAAFQELPDDA